MMAALANSLLWIAPDTVVSFGSLQLAGRGIGRTFLDNDGTLPPKSISEKIRVKIGGVDQGIFIKRKYGAYPVLLCLHGGLPEYFLTQHYPTGLEHEFTVVWWGTAWARAFPG